MKNIFEIMKEYGLEVPEDKKKDFEKAVLENYKTMTDYDNQTKKLDAANETIKANDTAMKDLQTKLDGFKDVDLSGLNQRIKDLETEKANIQKDCDAKIADRDFNDLVKESIASANGKNAKAITALLDVETLKTSKNQKEDIAAAIKALTEAEDSKMLFGEPDPKPAGNAVFGIKVGKSKAHFGSAWHDKAYSTKTKECYDGKTYTNITDLFRAYDSIEDAVEDYYDMLGTCKRYKDCVGERDARKCITAIKNGGYATAPEYIKTVMSIINQYNLTKYDGIATSQPTLRKGNRGTDVRTLQTLLGDKGYTVLVDGIFGNKTYEAVKAFQADRGLVVDGVVGVNTWKKLYQ